VNAATAGTGAAVVRDPNFVSRFRQAYNPAELAEITNISLLGGGYVTLDFSSRFV
jgi:hypothetical protein